MIHLQVRCFLWVMKKLVCLSCFLLCFTLPWLYVLFLFRSRSLSLSVSFSLFALYLREHYGKCPSMIDSYKAVHYRTHHTHFVDCNNSNKTDVADKAELHVYVCICMCVSVSVCLYNCVCLWVFVCAWKWRHKNNGITIAQQRVERKPTKRPHREGQE